MVGQSTKLRSSQKLYQAEIKNIGRLRSRHSDDGCYYCIGASLLSLRIPNAADLRSQQGDILHRQ